MWPIYGTIPATDYEVETVSNTTLSIPLKRRADAPCLDSEQAIRQSERERIAAWLDKRAAWELEQVDDFDSDNEDDAPVIAELRTAANAYRCAAALVRGMK